MPKIRKILYLAFVAPLLFSIGIQQAGALEVIKAKEITNAAFLPSKSGARSVMGQEPTFLGDDTAFKNAQADKPEFRIKSIGQIISERRAKKAEAAQNVPSEEEKKDDIQIFCKEMEYIEDTGELEAKEDVLIVTSDGTKATADKAIYNKEANTIRLIDNVVLTKGTATVEGDYMFIDLNEENALMNEPKTRLGNVIINAKEGYAFPNRIETLNGNVEFNNKVEMELRSQGFTRYNRAIADKRLVDFDLKKQRTKPYSFKTKEVIIRPEKDHDSMLMKDVSVYYNGKKIAKAPSIEIFQDKEMTVSEVDFPLEFSSLKGFGMYLGLGHTFKLPKTQTFRLTPAVVYGEDELGIGAIAQYRSKRARLEGGWSSSTGDLIFDGELKLFDKLNLELGRHAYKSEWLNGGNRAGYIAELAYDDRFLVKDLGDAVFRHRATAGYVADYRRDHQEDNMHDGYRYTYQAELRKNFKYFGAEEQDVFLKFGVVGQVMTSFYSQGDTLAFARFGPSISSRVKRWNSNITYTMGGVHGKSPYCFDEYRYGRQTVNFDESLILNRFLSVGYRGTLTLLKDNREGEILTENRFYAVAGPDDFKIAFSYDTIRQNMQFDFLFLLGTDNLDMKYEKLIINDPNKLGKREKKQSDKELYKVTVPDNL